MGSGYRDGFALLVDRWIGNMVGWVDGWTTNLYIQGLQMEVISTVLYGYKSHLRVVR